jgi:hypothetical protein
MKNEQIHNICLTNQDLLTDLGKKLYAKITEIDREGIYNFTEQDCIDYLTIAINTRTLSIFGRELPTIYGKLEKILKVKLEPVPDKWEGLYNVDFFININDRYIGLKIEYSLDGIQRSQSYKVIAVQQKKHNKFTKTFGGRVFIIFFNQNKW